MEITHFEDGTAFQTTTALCFLIVLQGQTNMQDIIMNELQLGMKKRNNFVYEWKESKY